MKNQDLKAMFANPPAPSAAPPVPVEVLDDDMGVDDAALVAASAPAPAPQAAPASAPVPAQASVSAAAPAAKAKVNKTTCKNTVTMMGWTDGKFIYGLHDGALPEDLAAAKRLLNQTSPKLHCVECSASMVSQKSNWEAHRKTDACLKARATPSNRFTGVLISALAVPTSVDLRLVIKLTNASLVSKGMSFSLVSDIGSVTSPILKGLCMAAGSGGLGSPQSVRDDTSSCIELVEEELIKKNMREIVERRLPMCIIADESTSKCDGRKSWMQMWLWHPCMTKPTPFDVLVVGRKPTAENLAKYIIASFTRPGYLTAKEFQLHAKIFTSDHAAAMLLCSKKLGATATGDPAHGVELIVKAVLTSLKMRPLLMLLRKCFTRALSTSFKVGQLDAAGRVEHWAVVLMSIASARPHPPPSPFLSTPRTCSLPSSSRAPCSTCARRAGRTGKAL